MEEIQMAVYLFRKEEKEINILGVIRMSFADMNFIDKKVSEIKEYTDKLSKLQRGMTLLVLKDSINDLLLKRSDH